MIVAPALLVAGAMLLPVFYLVFRATEAGPSLLTLLWSGRTFGLLLNSTGLALAVTAGAVALSIPLAWLTVRTDLPGQRVWAILAVLPLVVPSYVGAFTYVAALGPRGMLQQALQALFGVERLPEIYGFTGAWLVLTLFTYPYVLLTVRAALQSADPALEEAARSLGSSRWAVFRRVTLPQLRPALAAGGLLVALYTLSDFGVVSMLQFTSFTRAIYMQYQASFDRTLAAGLALLLVLLTVALLTGENAFRGRGHANWLSGRPVRPAQIARLGPWRWPALLFCAAVAGLALVLPLGVLGYWLVIGVQAPQGWAIVPAAAAGSVYAAGLAAVAAVAAALPVALLAVRYPRPLSALVERAAYAGFALPGIVVALALIFFGARYATPLYQTVALLVFAYVVRFLPQAVGAARASLLNVSPRVEEAARSLGRSWWRVVLEVTLPLVRPGLVSGFALVFLTAMKELPATLLLSPIGFRTLATVSWQRASEGFFAEAAVPSLLLVVVSGLSLAVVLEHGGGSEARHE